MRVGYGTLLFMYDEDDLTLLEEIELELESPLDHLESLTADFEVPEAQSGCHASSARRSADTATDVSARAFCDLEDQRATHLIHLLNDGCPLVRVSYLCYRTQPQFSAVEPLIDQLSLDWNGYVRKGVVWALGELPRSPFFSTISRSVEN